MSSRKGTVRTIELVDVRQRCEIIALHQRDENGPVCDGVRHRPGDLDLDVGSRSSSDADGVACLGSRDGESVFCQSGREV